MTNSLISPRDSALGIFSLSAVIFSLFLPRSDGQEKPSRTEIFHVGRVGMNGAAESRETLMAIFETVARDYNEKLKQEQQSSPQLFRGDRVRVLRDLGMEGAANLFLVAYDGGPTVFEVSGDIEGFDPGALSPALIIGEKKGDHSVEITRTVVVKNPKEREPQLETVDDTDGAVTFFGIPIPGTGKSSGGGSSANRSTGGGGGSRREEITETKMMPKFQAVVSTERLDGGPEQMSTQLFVSQLKNGEVFTVNQGELRRCQECRGFGRVQTTKPVGFRDPDGKMECPECKAKGKIDWDITYKITW